jgi:hypothetical protein
MEIAIQRFNQITRTQIWGLFQKLIRMRPNVLYRNSKLVLKQQSQKPRTLHLGCHMTRPSDKRNFTLALGALAGMIWLIKAGKQISHQNIFPSVLSGEIPHGSSTHDCTEVHGAQCFLYVMIKVSDAIMMAVAIRSFKTQCREHQFTYQNGLSKWHLCY